MDDIANVPVPQGQWATQCQVQTCYNRGFSIFGNNPTKDDFYKIATQVTHLHRNIFTQQNIATLNNLGWTKCHEDCTTLFPLAFDMTQHKLTCPYFNTAYKPPTHTTDYSGTHF
jgi:hypothetical protein